MKVATYNVNGVNGRLPRLVEWLAETAPDIVCLQEIKTDDTKFPAAKLHDAGYGAIWHGQRSHHGVAILARGAEPREVRRGLPGGVMPTQTSAACRRLRAQGWIDAHRALHPKERVYTFWVNDAAFRRNAGFRMDFVLLSPSLRPRLVEAGVDAEYRGREKPSDHAPT